MATDNVDNADNRSQPDSSASSISSEFHPDLISDIVPDGDVVFLVGPDQTRLRVDSHCTRLASPVFDAMFQPQWPEGRKLASDEYPAEIELPEDDPCAMRTILLAIHHRNDAIHDQMFPRDVLAVAVAADKYDFILALKYACVAWLAFQSYHSDSGRMDLVVAAYLFRNHELFRDRTLDLIMHSKGSVLDMIHGEVIEQVVPWRLFYLVEERRNILRAEILQMLLETARKCCVSCTLGQCVQTRCQELVAKYQPKTALEYTVHALELDLQTVAKSAFISRNSNTCDHSFLRELVDNRAFNSKLEAVKAAAALCLDCVQRKDGNFVCDCKT